MRFNIFSRLTASLVIYQIWPKYIRITSVRDSQSKRISRVKEKCREWKQQTRFRFIQCYCATEKVLFIFSSFLLQSVFESFRLSNFSFWLLENSFHRHLNWRSITDLHARKCSKCNWHCIQVIKKKYKSLENYSS